MTQGQHTPGPWTISHTSPHHEAVITGASGREVCTVPVILAYEGGYEGSANARLIASAPQLLFDREELIAALRAITPQLQLIRETCADGSVFANEIDTAMSLLSRMEATK